jgi:hypothetical protein
MTPSCQRSHCVCRSRLVGSCGCRKPQFHVVTCGAGDSHAAGGIRQDARRDLLAGIYWPADCLNCWCSGLGPTRAKMSNSWCYATRSACYAVRSTVRDRTQSTEPCWPCCLLRSPRVRWPVFFVQPKTLLRWYREMVARKWTYSTATPPGSPPTTGVVRELVLRFVTENPGWEYSRLLPVRAEAKVDHPLLRSAQYAELRWTSVPGVGRWWRRCVGSMRSAAGGGRMTQAHRGLTEQEHRFGHRCLSGA